MTARDTTKRRLVNTIAFIGIAALVTRTTRVTWINQDDRYAPETCFVLDERAQLTI